MDYYYYDIKVAHLQGFRSDLTHQVLANTLHTNYPYIEYTFTIIFLSQI